MLVYTDILEIKYAWKMYSPLLPRALPIRLQLRGKRHVSQNPKHKVQKTQLVMHVRVRDHWRPSPTRDGTYHHRKQTGTVLTTSILLVCTTYCEILFNLYRSFQLRFRRGLKSNHKKCLVDAHSVFMLMLVASTHTFLL